MVTARSSALTGFYNSNACIEMSEAVGETCRPNPSNLVLSTTYGAFPLSALSHPIVQRDPSEWPHLRGGKLIHFDFKYFRILRRGHDILTVKWDQVSILGGSLVFNGRGMRTRPAGADTRRPELRCQEHSCQSRRLGVQHER